MAPQPFSASIRAVAGSAILDLRGEINSQAEQALNQAYTQATVDNPASVILNFTNVGYINSTGIALIVGLLAQARKMRRPSLTAKPLRWLMTGRVSEGEMTT